ARQEHRSSTAEAKQEGRRTASEEGVRRPRSIVRMKTPLAALFVAALAASAAAQDVLVVAPKDFHAALADWKAYREKQGLAVTVAEPSADVAAQVKEVHGKSGGKLRFVVLVGDADKLPCATRKRQGAAIVGMGDAEPDIATDDPFADLDGDG